MSVSEVTGRIHHHSRDVCDGEPCPFHNPSLHPMVEEPMHLRETGLIERLCKHGVGHPDPDSAAWMDRRYGQSAGTWSVHGCDGCCTKAAKEGAQGATDNRASNDHTSR